MPKYTPMVYNTASVLMVILHSLDGGKMAVRPKKRRGLLSLLVNKANDWLIVSNALHGLSFENNDYCIIKREGAKNE